MCTDDSVEESDKGEEGDQAGGDVEDQHDGCRGALGSMLWLLKIFSPKNGKNCRFLLRTLLILWIITLVLENTPIFPENWRKSPKIVIMTFTPGGDLIR
jgi:hypothetical protein